MEAFLGIIIGALVSLGIVTYVKSIKKKKLVNSQSVLLLDKIKKVCKFITVEGDFAEIYHYEDVKERFLKMSQVTFTNFAGRVSIDCLKI